MWLHQTLSHIWDRASVRVRAAESQGGHWENPQLHSSEEAGHCHGKTRFWKS